MQVAVQTANEGRHTPSSARWIADPRHGAENRSTREIVASQRHLKQTKNVMSCIRHCKAQLKNQPFELDEDEEDEDDGDVWLNDKVLCDAIQSHLWPELTRAAGRMADDEDDEEDDDEEESLALACRSDKNPPTATRRASGVRLNILLRSTSATWSRKSARAESKGCSAVISACANEGGNVGK